VASNSHRKHTNPRNWLLTSIVLVLIAISGYLIFEFGRISAGYDIVDVARERQAYAERITTLDEVIEGLKQDVALLETHREIDRAAYKEVEASLMSLQGKIQEQRDAIAFYRGIVSPKDGNSGLRVQDLKLTRGNAEREFNLRLVLVQAMQHDRKVSGDVALSVEGSQDGVEAVYTLQQLIPEEADADWPFSFRYFQDFDRQLILPDGFTPARIRVEVRSKTRSIQSIEESYDWTTSRG